MGSRKNFSVTKENYDDGQRKAFRNRAKSVLKTTPDEYAATSPKISKQAKDEMLAKYATAGKKTFADKHIDQAHMNKFNSERRDVQLYMGKHPYKLEKMGINIVDPDKVQLNPEHAKTIKK